MQHAQFSNSPYTPLKRTYHFIFSGDKIDLYNELWSIRNILEKKGINLLDFLRIIDSILSTDLWVIQKITTIEHEMFNLTTSEEYFADAEDEVLKQKLNMYKEKKFKNYFHVSFYINAEPKDIMGKLYSTDFRVETDSFAMFTTV